MDKEVVKWRKMYYLRGPVGVGEAWSLWGLSENLEFTPELEAKLGRQVDVV